MIDHVERPSMAKDKDQREKNRERRFGLGRRIRSDRRAMDTPASKERRSGAQRRSGGNRRSGQDRRRDRRLSSAPNKSLP
jgi:hypothetical protein